MKTELIILGVVIALIGFGGSLSGLFSVTAATHGLKDQKGIVNFNPAGSSGSFSVKCDQVDAGVTAQDPNVYLVMPSSELGLWKLGTGSQITYRIPECATKACVSELEKTSFLSGTIQTQAYNDARSIPAFPLDVAVYSPPLPSFTPQQQCIVSYSLVFERIASPGSGGGATVPPPSVPPGTQPPIDQLPTSQPPAGLLLSDILKLVGGAFVLIGLLL